jgi:hypothetical protein
MACHMQCICSPLRQLHPLGMFCQLATGKACVSVGVSMFCTFLAYLHLLLEHIREFFRVHSCTSAHLCQLPSCKSWHVADLGIPTLVGIQSTRARGWLPITGSPSLLGFDAVLHDPASTSTQTWAISANVVCQSEQYSINFNGPSHHYVTMSPCSTSCSAWQVGNTVCGMKDLAMSAYTRHMPIDQTRSQLGRKVYTKSVVCHFCVA